jgi:hypothetical protein
MNYSTFVRSMRILIFILSLFLSLEIFAQGELDTQDKIFYRNERTYAFLLNSNGVGGNFRFAKRIDGFRKTLYEIELNYLKHPKESKISLPNTNRNIVFGKQYATYSVKGALGFQKEMFQKRDLGGISIRYFLNFGPSIAIMKPIFYEYWAPERGTYYDTYQPDKTVYEYNGKAPYLMGFNKLRVQPGIYGKFGYTFEYSNVDEVFHALELGAAFDAYIGKVPIMAAPAGKLLFVLPDDQFFLTLFISYRFGKIINTRANPRRTRIDEIITE